MSAEGDPVRFKVVATFTAEYEADPKDYGTSDPAEMARIDFDRWIADGGIQLIATFEFDGTNPNPTDERFELTVGPA